jgi:hypothetical protein
MQSFAINVDDCGMPPSTIFVEDTDVILPSTSQTEFSQYEMSSSMPKIVEGEAADTAIDMNNFVRDLFANDTRFLHTQKETNVDFLKINAGYKIGDGDYIGLQLQVVK